MVTPLANSVMAGTTRQEINTPATAMGTTKAVGLITALISPWPGSIALARTKAIALATSPQVATVTWPRWLTRYSPAISPRVTRFVSPCCRVLNRKLNVPLTTSTPAKLKSSTLSTRHFRTCSASVTGHRDNHSRIRPRALTYLAPPANYRGSPRRVKAARRQLRCRPVCATINYENRVYRDGRASRTDWSPTMPDPAVALTTTRSDAALAPRVYPAQDQNPAAVYLAHLKPSGRRTMHQALNVIAGLLTDGKAIALTCPWGALRFQHTMAIRALVADAYKPATANKMLSALRGTLKMAWRLEQMSAEEYARAADLPVVKGTTLPAGRELESAELDALLRICAADKTPAGARDAALISLLYTAGLRREEAAGLAYADYDPATDRLVVRGKGGKERAVYV